MKLLGKKPAVPLQLLSRNDISENAQGHSKLMVEKPFSIPNQDLKLSTCHRSNRSVTLLTNKTIGVVDGVTILHFCEMSCVE